MLTTTHPKSIPLSPTQRLADLLEDAPQTIDQLIGRGWDADDVTAGLRRLLRRGVRVYYGPFAVCAGEGGDAE